MAHTYKGALLPERPTPDAYRAVMADYEAMLIAVMDTVAHRFDPSYPFVNTKLDLITGQDFADEDPIRGRNAVYGWIQGRALEALSGHIPWLMARGQAALANRLTRQLQQVVAQVRTMRERNDGRLWFLMRPDGTPFRLDTTGAPEGFELTDDVPYGFTDLFASKGLFAVGCCLDDADLRAEALAYIGDVDMAIWSGGFENDQVPLDPKNLVTPVPGRHTHGPFMIQIGTAALLAAQGETLGVEMGLRLIEHELAHYANLDGMWPELAPGDMWEAVGDDGQPFVEPDGSVLSDPGHALECVGLILKFARTAKRTGLLDGAQRNEIVRIEGLMPHLLQRNFENGFLGKGTCKAFDLLRRQPMNTDLPWWNLPETLRSAALCVPVGKDRAICEAILRACHNAFTQHFVRPDLHLMAYQTISETGEPIAVIPASADADPGYHTGLSVIDALDAMAEWAV